MENGVWRTIRGRRVFIRDGEDLESAMKRSGKFGTKFSPEETENLRKAGGEAKAKEIDKIVKENLKNLDRGTKAREIDKINSDNDGEDKFYTRKDGTKEYDPYKGTRFEKKYDSAEEALNDPNHPTRKYIDKKINNQNVTTEQAKEFNKIAGAENTRSNIKSTKNLLNDLTKERPTTFDLWPKEEYVNASEYMETHNFPKSKSGKTYILNESSNRQEYRLPTEKSYLDNYIIKKDGSESAYIGYIAKEYRTDNGLSKKSLTELRNMANEYNVDTKGKSKKQLLSALISMFNK